MIEDQQILGHLAGVAEVDRVERVGDLVERRRRQPRLAEHAAQRVDVAATGTRPISAASTSVVPRPMNGS